MITANDIDNQRESIQNDLLCILEGLDDDVLDKVCDVVVERLNILKTKLESNV